MLKRKKIFFIIAGLLSLWLAVSLVASASVVVSLRQKKLSYARYSAYVAYPLSFILSHLTFERNATLETWRSGLEIVHQTDILTSLLTNPSDLESISISTLSEFFSTTQPSMQKLLHFAPQSPIVATLLEPEILEHTKSLKTNLPTLISYLREVSTGTHTWVLVFQNTEELRASGGFLGSYALVTVTDGTISEIVIEDVYDADGQFTGYIPPLAGHREYLSSDRGLRLPDANWQAHFPSSAQTIMQFFALGNKRSIEGIVAINLEVIEELVTLVEPIWLPDYQLSVTGSNLSSILRDQRSEFFAGSQDKKHLLEYVWQHLKLALNQSSFAVKQNLIDIVANNLERKDIQVYFSHPNMQTLVSDLGFAGELQYNSKQATIQGDGCDATLVYPHCPTDYFYILESNVGINKANRHVDRQFSLSLDEYRSQATITYKNTNLPMTEDEKAKDQGADHRAYVNYQRLILPPDVSVTSISQDGKLINIIDEELIRGSDQKEFKQIGFLVVVPEQTEQTVTLELSHNFKPSTKERKIMLQKQSGVSPYTVMLKTATTQKQLLLEQDTLLEL